MKLIFIFYFNPQRAKQNQQSISTHTKKVNKYPLNIQNKISKKENYKTITKNTISQSLPLTPVCLKGRGQKGSICFLFQKHKEHFSFHLFDVYTKTIFSEKIMYFCCNKYPFLQSF